MFVMVFVVETIRIGFYGFFEQGSVDSEEDSEGLECDLGQSPSVLQRSV